MTPRHIELVEPAAESFAKDNNWDVGGMTPAQCQILMSYSVAVSLRRIADQLETPTGLSDMFSDRFHDLAHNLNSK